MSKFLKSLIAYRHKATSCWSWFTGQPAAFRMEYRITHSITIVAILALAYNVPFNLFLGFYRTAFLSLIGCIIIIWLYYRSRFKDQTPSSVIIGSILINIIFIGNYFYHSGINGPNDILIAISVLQIIVMTPYKQHKIWLSLNILIVITLHGTEYYHPQLILYTDHDRTSFFLDKTSAYMVSVITTYYTIKYLRRNYNYEKRQVEEKKRIVEQQNQLIIEQNDQLEGINFEKNRLMSIIAHDLQAPLGNIQNYLELMVEHDLDTEIRKAVEADLLNVTNGTLNMLSKLLTWSKSQMGGVAVKLSSIKLLEELKNTLEMESLLALKKGIVFNYDIDPFTMIIADSDMLQIVIRNLVSNAIKFTDTGGMIHVNAELMMNECRIMVRDNGRGIPYPQQPDIFTLKTKPSFGTDKEKGVGIGLVLCKEFTERQGGRIDFYSAPGQGTTFHVYMPYDKSKLSCSAPIHD